MGVVEKFKRKLKELEKSINPSIKEAVDKNKALIIDQQTNEQLFDKGEDSKGAKLVPSYALSTKIIKKSKGQPTNRVTLKDSGDLYRSIKVDTTKSEMIISANIEYFKYLVAHYDKNIILGLQPNFVRKFVMTKVKPIIKNKWDKIIK